MDTGRRGEQKDTRKGEGVDKGRGTGGGGGGMSGGGQRRGWSCVVRRARVIVSRVPRAVNRVVGTGLSNPCTGLRLFVCLWCMTAVPPPPPPHPPFQILFPRSDG